MYESRLKQKGRKNTGWFSAFGQNAAEEIGHSMRESSRTFGHSIRESTLIFGNRVVEASERIGHDTVQLLIQHPIIQLVIAAFAFYLIAKGLHIFDALARIVSISIIVDTCRSPYVNRYTLLLLSFIIHLLLSSLNLLKPFFWALVLFDCYSVASLLYLTAYYHLLVMVASAGFVFITSRKNCLTVSESFVLASLAIVCNELLIKLAYITAPYLFSAIDFAESLYITRYTLLFVVPLVFAMQYITGNRETGLRILVWSICIFDWCVIINTLHSVIVFHTHIYHLLFLTVLILSAVGIIQLVAMRRQIYASEEKDTEYRLPPLTPDVGPNKDGIIIALSLMICGGDILQKLISLVAPNLYIIPAYVFVPTIIVTELAMWRIVMPRIDATLRQGHYRDYYYSEDYPYYSRYGFWLL